MPPHVSVKEAVFPFIKFAGVDIVLGPEMRSTGEVMGISERFSMAFAKSQLAAGTVLPQRRQHLRQRRTIGTKRGRSELGRKLVDLGFSLLATSGTADALEAAGVPCTREETQEGHPNLLDYFADRDVALVMNTPSGKGPAPTRARSAPPPCKPACPASPRSKPPPPPL